MEGIVTCLAPNSLSDFMKFHQRNKEAILSELGKVLFFGYSDCGFTFFYKIFVQF